MSVSSAARKVAEESVIVFENLIGGKWQPASDGRTIDMVSPSDGQVFARIARGTKADVDAAVKAARHAFEEGAWSKLTATERGRLMAKLGEAILAHHEELSQLEARDCGKPMKQARADITAAARYFEFYGAAADKVHGETIPFLEGYMVTILREAKGVTGHIIPWNYPAQMFGRSLAPALAMGNAVVMKPAEEACVAPMRLAQLAQEVGFPPGALNVVTGIGEEAGAALSAHPGIAFLSFTGSPEVGTLVQKAAAENHIGCTLELGGKSPQIVFEDADFDAAVPVVVNAIVQNGGQTCSAGSRVLVQKSIYDKFVTAVNLDMGSLGLDFLLANEATGYFPRRLVKRHINRRRLRIPARARAFTYPVYMVYPEARDEEAYEPILDGLRRAAERLI